MQAPLNRWNWSPENMCRKKKKINKSVTCNLVGKKFFNIEVFVYGTSNLAS